MNSIFFFGIRIFCLYVLSYLQNLLIFFTLCHYSEGKLKLIFITKKLNLLYLASYMSYLIIFIKAPSQY